MLSSHITRSTAGARATMCAGQKNLAMKWKCTQCWTTPFCSPTQHTVPLGVVPTIMSHYADFSFDYQNNGLGFAFELRFFPLLESLPVAVLVSGVTDRLALSFPTHFQQGLKVRVFISSLVRYCNHPVYHTCTYIS